MNVRLGPWLHLWCQLLRYQFLILVPRSGAWFLPSVHPGYLSERVYIVRLEKDYKEKPDSEAVLYTQARKQRIIYDLRFRDLQRSPGLPPSHDINDGAGRLNKD